jgi:hypothetical protein
MRAEPEFGEVDDQQVRHGAALGGATRRGWTVYAPTWIVLVACWRGSWSSATNFMLLSSERVGYAWTAEVDTPTPAETWSRNVLPAEG